jgi:hypothetical protein
MNKVQNMLVEVTEGCFNLSGNLHFSDAKCWFDEHMGVLSISHPATDISLICDMTQEPFLDMRHTIVRLGDNDINAFCVKLAAEGDDVDDSLYGTYRIECMTMEFSWLWCKFNISSTTTGQ